MEILDAKRSQAKIKLGLSAVSGGGKTMSALLIAYGLCKDWSKICLIDTENGSGSLYSHLGTYKIITLRPPFTPESYMKAMDLAVKSGMEVVIIDSISHEWEGKGGILEEVDKIGGGYTGAWKTLGPRHENFKNYIIQLPVHTITTVRRKQDYILQERQNNAGKTVQTPVKAGFKEITREGWEYELTINLELELNHMAHASKDRTGLFTDKAPFVPTIETGELIKAWCDAGEPLPELDLSWYDGIEACQTKRELLDYYNKFQKEIDADPRIQKILLERQNQLNALKNQPA